MNMFEWGHISPNVYISLCIVLIIMYMVIFETTETIGAKNAKKFYDVIEKCVVKCGEKCWADEYRGGEYYTFEDSDKCAVSVWEVTHFLMHAFLGFFTNIYISQSMSVGFELYEHFAYDCGSLLDLVWNFAGFATGHALKNAWSRHRWISAS